MWWRWMRSGGGKNYFEKLSGVYSNTCAGTLFSCCCAVDAKMARKYGEGLYNEAMTRLSFVCTGLIKIILILLMTPDDVTPYNLRKKRELALKRVSRVSSIFFFLSSLYQVVLF